MTRLRNVWIGALCLLSAPTLTGCVDANYDPTQKIDMTMAFDVEGVQMKIGSTEKIYLSDILETDENSMLKTDDTQNNLYYLEEKHSASFSFNTPAVKASLNGINLTPTIAMLTVPTTVTLPSGTTLFTNQSASAETNFTFKLNDIASEVVSIKRIKPTTSTQRFRITASVIYANNPNIFKISTNGLKLTFPSYIKCEQADANGTVAITSLPLDVTVSELEMPGDLGQAVNTQNGTRKFEVSGALKMEGSFTLSTTQSYKFTQGEKINISIRVEPIANSIEVAEATGVFNPSIKPSINPLQIREHLPDFLQDNDVVMDILNPTLYINADMQNIPASLQFSGSLTAMKSGNSVSVVRLPATGKATFNKKSMAESYFSTLAQPYIPGVTTTQTNTYIVPTLPQLIRTIPDELYIDLGNNQIQVAQTETATFVPNQYYSATIDYGVYIPLQFGGEMNILYTDSVTNMQKDLKDYAATSVTITTQIENTIPLDLDLDIIPYDKTGKTISAQIDRATVKASSETPVTVNMILNNPDDLKQLDKLVFRISAKAIEAGSSLSSKQYIVLKDCRLHLKGRVIHDFN